MKKIFFGSIAVLAIAAMAAFNVNMNTQENGLSDVSLANIEALASETHIYCPKGVTVLCGIDQESLCGIIDGKEKRGVYIGHQCK